MLNKSNQIVILEGPRERAPAQAQVLLPKNPQASQTQIVGQFMFDTLLVHIYNRKQLHLCRV